MTFPVKQGLSCTADNKFAGDKNLNADQEAHLRMANAGVEAGYSSGPAIGHLDAAARDLRIGMLLEADRKARAPTSAPQPSSGGIGD